VSGSLSIADILDRAADLIEPEGWWCQEAFARDSFGESVHPSSPDAVCFCATGAVTRAAGNRHVERHKALQVLANDFSPPPEFLGHIGGNRYVSAMAAWNDAPERTQSEVVSKLREAAALARSEGK
jgi:hypothetical protein